MPDTCVRPDARTSVTREGAQGLELRQGLELGFLGLRILGGLRFAFFRFNQGFGPARL